MAFCVLPFAHRWTLSHEPLVAVIQKGLTVQVAARGPIHPASQRTLRVEMAICASPHPGYTVRHSNMNQLWLANRNVRLCI